MKYFVLILIFIISASTSLVFASDDEEQVKVTGLSQEEKRLAKYIAGIELLEAERTITPDEKSAWYEKLSELTGLTAEQANNLVDRFKNNPEKWAKVLELASQEVIVKKKEVKKEKEDKNE